MRTIDNQPEDVFLGGWNLVLGAGLILAPWYFGFRSEDIAAWNAWITGATILALAALTLMRTREGEVYAIGAAGLWSCAAPWALGFQDAAAWAHVGLGVALLVSAGSWLWRLRDLPASQKSAQKSAWQTAPPAARATPRVSEDRSACRPGTRTPSPRS